MDLLKMTVTEFMEQIDSKSPTPGGGSVAAVSSMIGISLVRMYGHLTITKKKFKALDQSIQDKFQQAFESLEEYKNQLEPLVQGDTDAFNKVMDAFRLPKETDDEKKVRSSEILKATYGAIEVPYTVAQLSYNALKTLEVMTEYGNMNSITDFGVGVQLIYSGLLGAVYNVKINIPGLKNQKHISKYLEESNFYVDKGKEIKTRILKSVGAKL